MLSILGLHLLILFKKVIEDKYRLVITMELTMDRLLLDILQLLSMEDTVFKELLTILSQCTFRMFTDLLVLQVVL